MTDQERNKKFEAWYLHGGGFCGTCGEGCNTNSEEEVELFGKCEFNGNHPE